MVQYSQLKHLNFMENNLKEDGYEEVLEILSTCNDKLSVILSMNKFPQAVVDKFNELTNVKILI